MYIVQGVPVIRATGSIKLAINYAPVGEYPYYQDEMASFQDLVAQLGGKLNITSGIKVVGSTSSIIISNEEEGQLFYSKADKKLYQLVSGNIVVFFETYDKDTLDTKFSGKVDKLTTSGKYVYAHITAQQGEIQVSEDVINNAIPNRTNSGQLKVPETPTDNSHATSKGYVDSGLDLKADKATTYTKTETDNAIASAVSSVYKYKGSVATYNDLPSSDLTIGDVYNVEDTGDNYAWTGTDWDKLSGTVDLSGYYTKTETNALLDTKADKTTTYTKQQTDDLLDTKSDKATTYTKVQTDALLNEKANTSGEYPLLTVGASLTTKQIENVNDEVGSTQTNPFLFQGTGTNDNTTETPTAPVAKHLELRGNSVVWNQQTSPVDRSTNGITVSFNSSTGIITLTGESESTSTNPTVEIDYKKAFKFVGNKVMFRLRIVANPDNVSIRPYASNDDNGKASSYISSGTIGYIYTCNNPTVTAIQLQTNIELTGLQIVIESFDLTKIYGAGKEPTSVLAFNRDYPLPYYEYNSGELKSCSSSKLVTIGCNQLNELNTFIKVIAGQTYELSGISAGGYIEEYDAEQNLIKTSSEITSTTQITLTSNTHYVKVQATTYSNAMFRLYWNEAHEYVPYIKHEYDLPSVELRSVGIVYDTITPNGVYTQRIGVRTYESGDESDTSVITDLTNTYYVLETPIISEISLFAENIEVDDFGTMEFVATDTTEEIIVPQGNKFFYPADYVLFLDDMYNRSKDGGETSSANNFVTQSELQTAVGNIDISTLVNPTIKSSESSTYGLVSPDTTPFTSNKEIATIDQAFNVINASDIVNNTLSAEQYAIIRNGKPTIIKGTFLNMLNPILLTSTYLETFGMIIGANYAGNYTSIKYYEIYASGSNYVIQTYGNKRIEFNNLHSINGIEIDQYYKKPQASVSLSDGGTITDTTLKSLIQNEQPIKLNGFTCYFSYDDGTKYQYVSTRYDSSANKNHINVITIDKSTWVATFHTSDIALN